MPNLVWDSRTDFSLLIPASSLPLFPLSTLSLLLLHAPSLLPTHWLHARVSGFLYITGHGVDPELMDRALAGTRQFFFDTPLEVCCTASAVTTAALCIVTEITSHARTGSHISSVFLCRTGHCWLRRRAALAKLWIQLLCTCRQRTVAVWTVWSCRRKSWCLFGATILREVTSV